MPAHDDAMRCIIAFLLVKQDFQFYCNPKSLWSPATQYYGDEKLTKQSTVTDTDVV